MKQLIIQQLTSKIDFWSNPIEKQPAKDADFEIQTELVKITERSTRNLAVTSPVVDLAGENKFNKRTTASRKIHN
jgi:hypothetical protein